MNKAHNVPEYHKPDYVTQAEFCRLYEISVYHLKKRLCHFNGIRLAEDGTAYYEPDPADSIYFEYDRHQRRWIHVSEGDKKGLKRRNPPGEMPAAEREKHFVDSRTKISDDLPCVGEIVELVRSIKAERDELRRQLAILTDAVKSVL
jgi:hypothetical protein